MVAPGVVSAPDPDLARGGQVLLLLTNVDSWVRRRVETVRFTEEGLVRRFVSLDFSVDGSWPKVAPSGDGSDGVEAGGRASMLVPLALLRKEPLALLDVIDETGATLPVLGTYENGFLAYSALCAVATIVRGNDEPLPADLQSTLYAVAMQPESLALAALDDLKRSPDGSSGKIARDQIFLKLATDLCQNFILLAEVKHAEERSTARRIIKFSYTTSPIRTARRRPKQWLVRPHEQRFDFDLPSVGDAESHHFQLVPPAGIEVSRCRLRLKPQFLDESTRLGSKVGGTAHLHATRAGSGSSAVAEIELSPSGHGPVLAATVASGVVLLVTLAYLGFVLGPTPDQNGDGGEAWQAMLAAVPGVAAGFMANQGEHGFLSTLLGGARATLLTSAAASLALTIALTLTSGGLLRGVVIAASVVSGVCFARLVQWLALCRSATAQTQS